MKTQGGALHLRILKIGWVLGLISLGLNALLLVFSLIFGTSPLANVSVAIGFAGMDIRRAAEGPEVAMILPVAFNASSRGRPASTDHKLENLRANLLIPIESRTFFSGSLAIIMILTAGGLWIISQLRYVFQNVADGQPFAAGNAEKIHRIGWGVIVLEILRSAAVLFWSYSSMFTFEGATFVPTLDIGKATIICGLIILAIAEVFREGSRLRDEQSLTI
ncbi:MAG: DUF2975 domain-containing protein [Acidobacteriota bacterium]